MFNIAPSSRLEHTEACGTRKASPIEAHFGMQPDGVPRLTCCIGGGFGLPIAARGAVATRPSPSCPPVSGAVTFAARQIVVGAVLPLFMLLGASQADAEAGHFLDRLRPAIWIGHIER